MEEAAEPDATIDEVFVEKWLEEVCVVNLQQLTQNKELLDLVTKAKTLAEQVQKFDVGQGPAETDARLLLAEELVAEQAALQQRADETAKAPPRAVVLPAHIAQEQLWKAKLPSYARRPSSTLVGSAASEVCGGRAGSEDAHSFIGIDNMSCWHIEPKHEVLPAPTRPQLHGPSRGRAKPMAIKVRSFGQELDLEEWRSRSNSPTNVLARRRSPTALAITGAPPAAATPLRVQREGLLPATKENEEEEEEEAACKSVPQMEALAISDGDMRGRHSPRGPAAARTSGSRRLSEAGSGSRLAALPAVPEDAVVLTATDDEDLVGEGRVIVKVWMDGEEGTDAVTLRVRPMVALHRILRAWCACRGFTPKYVRVHGDGRQLRLTDSPESIGWDASQGPLMLKATFCEEGAQEELLDSSTRAFGSAQAPETADFPAFHETLRPFYKFHETAPTQHPGRDGPDSEAVGPRTSDGDERVPVTVLARDVEGLKSIDMKMGLRTKFEKVMRTWCQLSGVALGETCFQFEDGREVLPSQTPLACDWSLAHGPLVIRALPRPGEEGRGMTQEASCCSIASSGIHQGVEKIDVHMTAHVDSAPPVVGRLRMRPTTTFETMMQAWCKHERITAQTITVDFEGRRQPLDNTPETCGWTHAHGVLVVQASLRTAIATFTSEAKRGDDANLACVLPQVLGTTGPSLFAPPKEDEAVRAHGTANGADARKQGPVTFGNTLVVNGASKANSTSGAAGLGLAPATAPEDADAAPARPETPPFAASSSASRSRLFGRPLGLLRSVSSRPEEAARPPPPPAAAAPPIPPPAPLGPPRARRAVYEADPPPKLTVAQSLKRVRETSWASTGFVYVPQAPSPCVTPRSD